MDWYRLAACRDKTELFFSAHKETTARQLCRNCVVSLDCLQVAGNQDGIWGGLSKDERKLIPVQSITLQELQDLIDTKLPGRRRFILRFNTEFTLTFRGEESD